MANLSSIYKASNKKIAAVWEFESSDLFDEGERAALRLAYKATLLLNEASDEDEDEDFAALAKHFDEGEVVEIVASVALFGFLNRWNDTMSTELETLPKQVAERALQDTDWKVGKHQ